jgi:hypothetical protein
MTYALRPIGTVPRSKSSNEDGPCACGHPRDMHFHGKTDKHPVGWHACLSVLCSCSGYQKGEAK